MGLSEGLDRQRPLQPRAQRQRPWREPALVGSQVLIAERKAHLGTRYARDLFAPVRDSWCRRRPTAGTSRHGARRDEAAPTRAVAPRSRAQNAGGAPAVHLSG